MTRRLALVVLLGASILPGACSSGRSAPSEGVGDTHARSSVGAEPLGPARTDHDPYQFDVTEDGIYYSNRQTISRQSKDGQPPTTVWSPPDGGTADINHLTVKNGTIYAFDRYSHWDGTTVRQITLSGTQTIATEVPGSAYGYTVVGSHAYVAGDCADVVAIPLDGGPYVRVRHEGCNYFPLTDLPFAVNATASHAFIKFLDEDALLDVDLATGVSTIVEAAFAGDRIAVDGDTIFVIEDGTCTPSRWYFPNATHCEGGRLRRMEHDGSGAVELLDLAKVAPTNGYLPLDEPVLDADYIYFTVVDMDVTQMTIYRLPRGGGEPEALYVSKHPFWQPMRLGIDATFLYFVEQENAVAQLMRIAKSPSSAAPPVAGNTADIPSERVDAGAAARSSPPADDPPLATSHHAAPSPPSPSLPAPTEPAATVGCAGCVVGAPRSNGGEWILGAVVGLGLLLRGGRRRVG
jgi:hypothetical protein